MTDARSLAFSGLFNNLTFFALLALAACRADPPPDMDAGMDAGMDADMDAAIPSECWGSATPCPLLSSIAACSDMEGCGWTACAGDPACAAIPDETTCRGVTDCVWDDRPLCRGVATPCEVLDEDACGSQRGCRWGDQGDASMDAGMDAAPPPSCPPDFERPPGCMAPAGDNPTGCNAVDGIECDGDWTGVEASTGLPFCETPCAAEECCAPVDGSFRCVGRDGDGQCPASDIFLDGSRVGYLIETRTFDASSCSLAEGCVGGSGERRLLQFETWTPNIGQADLFLGAVPAMGVSTDIYTWSPCHGHHHFRGFATYELLSPDLCCVAAGGHKQAFCLTDLARHDESLGGDFPMYDCSYQGIQRGWEDAYTVGVECQWVDITDVPPGDYYLRVRINEEHLLLESNYDNNEVVVPVRI